MGGERRREEEALLAAAVASAAGRLGSSPVSAAAMDEQAGPGVFFSNNHPGAGGAKGLGPLAEAAPAGDGVAAAGAARAQYSLPGILHFLQHEWARFEVERAQWEVERAELQVKTLPAFFIPPLRSFRPAPDPSPPPPLQPWRPSPSSLRPILLSTSFPSSLHLCLPLTPLLDPGSHPLR